jgi:hypothetical protein
MKTKISIIAGICSIALLSFAFSTLDSNKSINHNHSKNSSSENSPAGGFASEEIKR